MRDDPRARGERGGFVADWTGTTPQTCVDIGMRVLSCRMPRARVWDYDNLAAPYWRLYWNDRSGGTVIAGGARIALRPDRFVLIPPDVAFATSLERSVRHFHLHFLTRLRLRRGQARPFVFPAERMLRALLDELDGFMRGGRDGRIEFTTRAAALAQLALARVPPAAFADAFVDARVAQVAAFLREHLARAVSNDEVGAAAGMSAGAAVRLFRREAGMTPMAFLSRIRVEGACVLLEHTDDTIERIAAATGFSDRYYFSRVFAEARGVGPATYRRSMVQRPDAGA